MNFTKTNKKYLIPGGKRALLIEFSTEMYFFIHMDSLHLLVFIMQKYKILKVNSYKDKQSSDMYERGDVDGDV
jgi:hypothetical protein